MPGGSHVDQHQVHEHLKTFSTQIGKIVTTANNFIAIIVTLENAFGHFLQLFFNLVDLYVNVVHEP